MLKSLRVRDYMSTHLPTLRADQDVFMAVDRMLDHRTSGLAVLDEHGCLIGYLSDGDCLRAILTGLYHEEAGGQVGSCMTVEVETVSAQSSILDVAELFSAMNIVAVFLFWRMAVLSVRSAGMMCCGQCASLPSMTAINRMSCTDGRPSGQGRCTGASHPGRGVPEPL